MLASLGSALCLPFLPTRFLYRQIVFSAELSVCCCIMTEITTHHAAHNMNRALFTSKFSAHHDIPTLGSRKTPQLRVIAQSVQANVFFPPGQCSIRPRTVRTQTLTYIVNIYRIHTFLHSNLSSIYARVHQSIK